MSEHLLNGFAATFTPMTFLVMLLGTVGGIIIGALPGMSGSMGMILMMPLLYHLPTTDALIVLAGIFCGSMYGGSISAILISTPGTPSASATLLDGYPMTQQGKAGKALGISVFASFGGGMLSSVALLFIAPELAKIAMSFRAEDYFSLSIFGLTIMAGSSGRNLLKGLVAGWLGLLLSVVGVDPVMGLNRLNFGIPNLMSGIDILPVLIGVFALAQVIENAETPAAQQETVKQDLSDVWPRWPDIKQVLFAITVGSVIGILIGIVPGTGGSIACFLAYDVVKRLSRNGDKFGTGVIEGIAAPESSNNATTGGAMIPLFTLGIPGDVQTAVMLGALMLIGVRPGPLLFTEQPQIIYTLLAGMFVIQFAILIFGLAACKFSPHFLRIPAGLLNPAIVLFCVLGAYTLRNNLFDVLMTCVFGVVGYGMKKHGYPGAPMVLGLILGPMAEDHLNRALLIGKNDWSTFFTRPISCAFLVLSALSVGLSFYSHYRGNIKENKNVHS